MLFLAPSEDTLKRHAEGIWRKAPDLHPLQLGVRTLLLAVSISRVGNVEP